MTALGKVAEAAARLRTLDPALLLLAAMVFVVQVGVAVMLPLLPLYALSLGASPTVLGLLTSVFALTNAAGQLLTGFLAERLPLRRLLAAGIGSYAVANFLIAAAPGAILLIAFRGFAGVGGGVMLVGERLYLAQLVDRARLGFANGVLSAAGSAGAVAGPAVGGVLATLGDLRTPFLLVGVTSLLATVGALFLPNARREQDGTALSADEQRHEHADDAMSRRDDGQDVATADGIEAGPAPAADVAVGGPAERTAAVTAPDVAVDAPLRTETEQQSRDRPLASDRRRLAVLLFAQLGLMSSFGAFITTYGPFAEEELGWVTAEVGIVFALFGLGAILLGPWLGRQADVHGRRNIAILATLPIVVFSVVYWFEAPRPLLYVAAIAAGAGVTGVTAAWYALLADATDGGRQRRRFGTVAAIGNLGIIVGATLAAQLWELLDDVSIGFVVAGVSVALCGVAFLFHPPDRPRGQRPAAKARASTAPGH